MAKNNSLFTITYQVKTQEELDRLMNACQVLGLESGSELLHKALKAYLKRKNL